MPNNPEAKEISLDFETLVTSRTDIALMGKGKALGLEKGATERLVKALMLLLEDPGFSKELDLTDFELAAVKTGCLPKATCYRLRIFADDRLRVPSKET